MQITNKSVSPLRYPGGKTKLAPFLSHTILINQIKNPIFCEPFAGGAGLSLKLLLEGKIERIILNDVDQGIYSFWYAVFFDIILSISEPYFPAVIFIEFSDSFTNSLSEYLYDTTESINNTNNTGNPMNTDILLLNFISTLLSFYIFEIIHIIYYIYHI